MWSWRHGNVCCGQDIYWQAVVTAQHHSGRWSLCEAIRRCCWSQIGFFSELPAASGYRQASSRDWWGHQQYLQTRGVKGKKKTYMNGCNILQNKRRKKSFLDLSPMILAAVDAPTMMERFGAMNDILDSTYSYILCLDWFSSRAMSHASSSCFSSSSLSIELKPWNHRTSTHWGIWAATMICSCEGRSIDRWQAEVSSPLCGWGCDTDNHDSSIGEDLLQSFIVLAFLQIIS